MSHAVSHGAVTFSSEMKMRGSLEFLSGGENQTARRCFFGKFSSSCCLYPKLVKTVAMESMP